MNLRAAAAISAGTAHVLAWIVALWLVFGPVYQGVSVSAVAPGATPGEPIRTTATLIEVNGWYILPILLVPAALTALALLAVLTIDPGQRRRRILVWVPAVLLLGFCILGSLSIGIFYLPSALALVLSSLFVATRPSRRTSRG